MIPSPDGTFLVMPSFNHPAPQRCTGTSVKTHAVPPLGARIDQLQYGSGRHEARLHVRLAEGPFAGVEIRGVQCGARVRIEVVQDPARPPIDLEELRRTLSVRGINAVDLSFADARDAPRRPRQETLPEELEDLGVHTAHRARPEVREDEF